MVGYHSHNLTGKSIAVVVINGNQNIYICKKKRWFNCESISILMIWLIWKTGSKKIILTEYCLWLSCHLNIWCTSAMNRNANQGKLHHRSLIQAASNFFLAVQNSSIGDLVTHSLTHSLTDSQYFYFWLTNSDPRDLQPLRHLIKLMRRQDQNPNCQKIVKNS